MNFKFKTLTMEGYRAYKEKTVFQIEREPGLYYITGTNSKAPTLGANALGKSTIFDAIVWCLEGKTTRGIKGPSVVNWSSKTAKVSVEIETEDHVLVVTRTQAPNSLTLSIDGGKPETVVQNELDKLFCDYQKFIYMTIVPQFDEGKNFMELGPTDRLELFSSIMDLDFWEQCAETANTKSKELESALKLAESQVKGTEETVSSLKESQKSYLGLQEGFEETRQTQKADLEAQITATQQEIVQAIKAEQLYELRLVDTENTTYAADLNRIKENMALITADLRTMSEMQGKNKQFKLEAMETLDRWKGINDCPYCQQPIAPEVSKQHKTHATKEILRLNKEGKTLETKIEGLDEQYAVNDTKWHEIRALLDEQIINTSNWRSYKSNAAITKTLKRKELEQLSKQLVETDNLTNSFTQLLEKNHKELAAAETKLACFRQKIEGIQRDILGTKFWVKGFKEMRLWLIADALVALESATNEAAIKLGLINWVIRFHIEKETSTKTTSKGLFVSIHSPEMAKEDYVPIEVWSGGETQRLKLSSVIGLAELIKAYKGVDFNWSAWDEPTTHLSPEGINDLISFLHNEAIKKEKVVYFVDHSYIENPIFKETISVKNGDAGSRID